MVMCYTCKAYKTLTDFKATSSDPFAQICNTCKQGEKDTYWQRVSSEAIC